MADPSIFPAGVLPPTVLPGLSFPSFPGPGQAQTIAMVAQLNDTQWWPTERIRAMQLEQLQAVLRHAAATTHYGRKHFRDLATAPLTWERFRQLPVMSREVVQTQTKALRSNQVPKSHGPISMARSSGSTSRPVEVARCAVAGLVWHAVTARSHLWHRRDCRLPLATVRHSPDADQPGGVARKNWGPALANLGQTGPCHVLHIGASTREQLAWLRSRPVSYLMLYPSSLQDLLRLSPECPCPDLRAVMTFAEVVDPELRVELRDKWGVPLQDVYSTQEAGYLALQCPDHEHYHVQAESVHLEVVREDGTPCDPGERGKVLITPLHNFAQALVRYDVGDFAVVGEPCPCGRGLPVLERIVGRVHQTFMTAAGDRIWLTVGVHELPKLAPILQHQFVQRQPGQLELRLVEHRAHTPAEEAALVSYLMGKLPEGTELSVVWVDEIPRTGRGKFLSFRSEL